MGETDGGDVDGWGDLSTAVHCMEYMECTVLYSYSVSIWVFRLDLGLAVHWHDLNDGLHENATWRNAMIQALGLPPHEAIIKSRVANSGWSFMLTV